MTQSADGFAVPNGSGATVRAAINADLQALASSNSGAGEPPTTFPHMWWPDETNNLLKLRDKDNSTWITIGTLDEVNKLFQAAGAVPSGFIGPYAGSTAPTGWLLCFGQAVSRTTYAGLFTAIGSSYGAGDGSTTFNVPDLRGRVAAGVDSMGGTAANRLGSGSTGGVTGSATLGAVGGEQSHTLTSTEMPQHNHGVTDPGHHHTTEVGGPNAGGSTTAESNADVGPVNTSTATTGISIQNAGGGAAHNVVQPTLVLNYIIKT